MNFGDCVATSVERLYARVIALEALANNLPVVHLQRPIIAQPSKLVRMEDAQVWLAYMRAKIRTDGATIGTPEDQFWYVCGFLGSGEAEGKFRDRIILEYVLVGPGRFQLRPELIFTWLAGKIGQQGF